MYNVANFQNKTGHLLSGHWALDKLSGIYGHPFLGCYVSIEISFKKLQESLNQ